ncbi:ABC transporter permease [Segnochrobactraceae bacterium EtOH-i3]
MSLLDLKSSFGARMREPGAGPNLIGRRPARAPALGRLLAVPGARPGAALLLFILVLAVFGPLLRPGDPMRIVGPALVWPGQDAAFPLGTDGLGRDLLTGILHGARISVTIGLAVAVLSLGFGVLVGAIAGYAGGRIDRAICRGIEVFQTIPGFVLLVVLVAVLEPSFVTVILGLALISWDMVARLTRAEVRAHRTRDYVVAAEAFGFSHPRILVREILPNIAPTLIVTGSVIVASAILSESALSFLGLGDPNTVSWGSLIGAGREHIRSAWYLTAIPGVFIALTVLALNLLGDALNDFLNPRGQDR